MFTSVLMNELFRSSEFIYFGVQQLVKAHKNSKQCLSSFVPQPKQYVTCSQPDSTHGHTRMGPAAANENYVRISGGQSSARELCTRIQGQGLSPELSSMGWMHGPFKTMPFFFAVY